MSYTISSNLLSLIISTLVVLIIPKLIGVEDVKKKFKNAMDEYLERIQDDL